MVLPLPLPTSPHSLVAVPFWPSSYIRHKPTGRVQRSTAVAAFFRIRKGDLGLVVELLKLYKLPGWRSPPFFSALEILPGVGLPKTRRSIHRRRPAILRIQGIRGRPTLAGVRRPESTPRPNLILGARRVATTVNVPAPRTTSAKGNRTQCRRGDPCLALLPAAPLTHLPLRASPPLSPRSLLPSEAMPTAMISRIEPKAQGIDSCPKTGALSIQPTRHRQSCATS